MRDLATATAYDRPCFIRLREDLNRLAACYNGEGQHYFKFSLLQTGRMPFLKQSRICMYGRMGPSVAAIVNGRWRRNLFTLRLNHTCLLATSICSESLPRAHSSLTITLDKSRPQVLLRSASFSKFLIRSPYEHVPDHRPDTSQCYAPAHAVPPGAM